MIEKFDKYWYVVHGILGVATVLDPRFKLKLLKYYFPLIYEDVATQEIMRIKGFCYELLTEYQTESYASMGGEMRNQEHSGSSFSSVVHNVVSEDPLVEYDKFTQEMNINMLSKSELDCYLEEPVLPRTPNFDILAWWNTHGGLQFPILKVIARDVLAIPISAVASESVFSTSGRLVGPHRSRLHPKTLEALMCAQNWFLAELDDSASKGEKHGRDSILVDSEVDEEEEGEDVPIILRS